MPSSSHHGCEAFPPRQGASKAPGNVGEAKDSLRPVTGTPRCDSEPTLSRLGREKSHLQKWLEETQEATASHRVAQPTSQLLDHSRKKGNTLPLTKFRKLPLLAPLPKPLTATVGTDFALPGSLHSPLRGSLSDSNGFSTGWSSRRVLPLPPIAMSRVAPDDSGLASPLPKNESNGESLNANVLSTALTAVTGDLPKPSPPNTTEERCRSEDVRTENLDDDEHKGSMSSANFLHSNRSMRVMSKSGSSISLASSRANRAARKKKLADIQGEPEWPDPKKYNHTTEFLMTLKNPIRRS